MVESAVDRVSFYCSLYYIQLVRQKMNRLDAMVEFDGKVFSVGGEPAQMVTKNHVLSWPILKDSHTFASGVTCAGVGGVVWMGLCWIISRGLWSFCTMMCLSQI